MFGAGREDSLANISLARVFVRPEPVSNITTEPNTGITATGMTFDLCMNFLYNYDPISKFRLTEKHAS